MNDDTADAWRARVDGAAADVWAISRSLAENPADALFGWLLTWLRFAEDPDAVAAPSGALGWQLRVRETAITECIRAVQAARWHASAVQRQEQYREVN